MKKITTITMACAASLFASADDFGLNGPEVLRVVAVVLIIGMCMYFILTVMKRILDNKLKNKIVDKGISENVAQSLLETKTTEESKHANIKWFAILAGIGIGLLGVNYTEPIGIHSLAIMAFSISLSFLGYYLFIRNAGK